MVNNKKAISQSEKYQQKYQQIKEKVEQAEFEKLRAFLMEEWQTLDAIPLEQPLRNTLDRYKQDIINNNPEKMKKIRDELDIEKDIPLSSSLFGLYDEDRDGETKDATIVQYNDNWSERSDQNPDYRWKIWKEGGSGLLCKELANADKMSKTTLEGCHKYMEETYQHLEQVKKDLEKNPPSTKRIRPIPK